MLSLVACVLRTPETVHRLGPELAVLQGEGELTGQKDTEGEKLCTKAEASTKLCKKEAGGGRGVGQRDTEGSEVPGQPSSRL